MARNYFLYVLLFWITMITAIFLIRLPISLNLISMINIDQVEKGIILISLNQLIGEYFSAYSIIIWLIISVLSVFLFSNQKNNLIFCSILYLFTFFTFMFLILFYGVMVSNNFLLFSGISMSILLLFLPSSTILFIKSKYHKKEEEKQEKQINRIEFQCPSCQEKFNSNPKYCSNCSSLMKNWFQMAIIILK